MVNFITRPQASQVLLLLAPQWPQVGIGRSMDLHFKGRFIWGIFVLEVLNSRSVEQSWGRKRVQGLDG